jgi:hypothetical protein
MLINAKMFWNKIFTKLWLSENTSFSYPNNLINPGRFYATVGALVNAPMGEYVWKPQSGRQSSGIALLEKTSEGFIMFPDKDLIAPNKLRVKLNRIRKIKLNTPKKLMAVRSWFAEEWIYPHERLHKFTDDIRCPPVIRLIGHDRVSFIGLTPLYFEHSGISNSGWKDRKYIWVDLEGVIRSKEDIDLKSIDSHTAKVVKEKSLETAPFGEKLGGIPEVVEQINKEIVPKVKRYRNQNWSVDGTFDKNNKFVIIEINHNPGTQFKGVVWKK